MTNNKIKNFYKNKKEGKITMNKYIIDEKTYNRLLKWAEVRKGTLSYCEPYFKKSEVVLPGSNNQFKYYVEAGDNCHKIETWFEGKLAAEGKITADKSGEHEYSAYLDFIEIEPEDTGYVVEHLVAFVVAYIHANCFMHYGSVCEAGYLNKTGDALVTAVDQTVMFKMDQGRLIAVSFPTEIDANKNREMGLKVRL